MKKAFLFVIIAAVAASFGATARSEGEGAAMPVDMVVLSDGDAQTGCVTDITPEGVIKLATEFTAKPVEISLTRVSAVNMNTKDPDLSRRIRKSWMFYTADGARISGHLESWSDDFLTVKVDYAAEVKIPRENLMRISMNGVDFFGQSDSDKPTVFLASGGQKVTGAIKELNGDNVVVAGAPDQTFRIAVVAGIALPQVKAAPVVDNAGTGWYAFVEMPNGDRIIGQIDKFADGTLYLITQNCGVLEIKRDFIAKMTFSVSNRQSFGNTLLSDNTRNLIVELDPQGREVWKHECQDPMDARMLPNGNILWTSGLTGTVSEIDKKGNVAWSKDGLKRPTSAVVLPDGNIAVAENGNFRIVIFDRQGNQVKTLLEGKEQPGWIDTTPQGTLLITSNQGTSVVELDMDGNILWRKVGLQQASCARMLPNGDIALLESASSKLRIFRKPDTPVRSIDVGMGQRAFKVLTNGNILVVQHNVGDTSTNPTIREIDPVEGKTVRETQVQSKGFSAINAIDRN